MKRKKLVIKGAVYIETIYNQKEALIRRLYDRVSELASFTVDELEDYDSRLRFREIADRAAFDLREVEVLGLVPDKQPTKGTQ